MYKIYTYTVYIKIIYQNGKVLILFASEVKLEWLFCCCMLTWVLFPFFPPLKKAPRAHISAKEPLNFLSGSHSGYMIKKECVSLNRPWLTWPGEILGLVIPWESDKLWSSDFFLCISVILVGGSLHGSAAPMWPCMNPWTSQFFSLLLSEIQKIVIYPCLAGLTCGLSVLCCMIPWWKLSCKLW